MQIKMEIYIFEKIIGQMVSWMIAPEGEEKKNYDIFEIYFLYWLEMLISSLNPIQD